jgi:hypothetical protein
VTEILIKKKVRVSIKTYTGSFDTYGGLGKNNGSPGTSFFYHTGFLLITPSNLTMMQEAKHHLKRCYHPCCNKYLHLIKYLHFYYNHRQ